MKLAAEKWGTWSVLMTDYDIRVDKFRSQLHGDGVIAYFRTHDLLASIKQKKGLEYKRLELTLRSLHISETFFLRYVKASESEVETFRKDAEAKGRSVKEVALSAVSGNLLILAQILQDDFRILEWAVRVEGPVVSVIGNLGKNDNPPSWAFVIGSNERLYATTARTRG